MQPVNILQALPENTQILLSSNPSWEHWGCCIVCRKLLGYKEYKALGITKKLPIHCECELEADRKKRSVEERKRRTLAAQKTFNRYNLIPEALMNAGFKNFTQRPGTEKCYNIAKAFYVNFEKETNGYVFFGGVGCGKSHLARAIQRSLDSEGWPTLFLDWPTLADLSRRAIRDGKIDIGAIVRAAVDVDLLVIDDIGAGHLTDYEYKSIAFPVINGRQGKKTIYTSNLDPERLDAWFATDKDNNPLDVDGRCMDRIIGSCTFIRNKATSYRRERPKILE